MAFAPLSVAKRAHSSPSGDSPLGSRVRGSDRGPGHLLVAPDVVAAAPVPTQHRALICRRATWRRGGMDRRAPTQSGAAVLGQRRKLEVERVLLLPTWLPSTGR
jgi:hypothetical protein